MAFWALAVENHFRARLLLSLPKNPSSRVVPQITDSLRGETGRRDCPQTSESVEELEQISFGLTSPCCGTGYSREEQRR
jgi:hypothetical protein